jgi:hypothetical protein
MPKSKIDAKAIREGDKGIKFQVQVNADAVKVHCLIDLKLTDEAKVAAVLAAAQKAETMLDGMEVDPANADSVNAYVQACGFALQGVVQATA